MVVRIGGASNTDDTKLSRQFILANYPSDIAETKDHTTPQLISDTIPATSSDDIGSETLDREVLGIAVRIKGNKGVFITLPKTKLSTQDVQGFKQWLQDNNVTVVYQLAQEEVYECLPISVASYKSETTYKVDSGVIAPASSFELDYTLSNAVNRISDVKVFNNAMKDNLKANLTNKGVKVTDSDKMSSLIGKVNNISSVFEEPITKLRLFHADYNTEKLYELDVNTLQPIRTVNPPSIAPIGIGGGFDGNKLRLFHTDGNIEKLYELDVDTLQPIKTVNSSGILSYGIGGGFDGNKLRLFHTNNTKKIYELDINTLQPIKTVNSSGNYPRGIGGGFDGNKLRLFHADYDTEKIYELDINTLQPIKTVNSPDIMPIGIGGGFDGNKLRLFHADANTDKIYELNVDTLQVVKVVHSPGTEAFGIGGGHYMVNKKYVMHNGIKYELKEV